MPGLNKLQMSHAPQSEYPRFIACRLRPLTLSDSVMQCSLTRSVRHSIDLKSIYLELQICTQKLWRVEVRPQILSSHTRTTFSCS